jgi:hypothetical protein
MRISKKNLKLFLYFAVAVIILGLLMCINYREGYIDLYENNSNIIKKVAFLIPSHPPHYHYIYNLVNNLTKYDIKVDIYLVFSNMEDYNKFTMKNEIKPIICDSYKTNSIITYKKFFGLKHLANSKYDHIICCDSEIDIISKNFNNSNINNKLRDIFNNKYIYAGYSNDPVLIEINKKSANMFQEKYDYLKDITNNFSLYFWYSDLPVYRKEDILPFLNMINYENLIWEHFDYILYQYYLILYHRFQIVNTTPITKLNFSFERLNTNDINILQKLLDIKYGFGWVNKQMYDLNKDFLESHKTFLIYNLDRSL